jgi:hypothetical protein
MPRAAAVAAVGLAALGRGMLTSGRVLLLLLLSLLLL